MAGKKARTVEPRTTIDPATVNFRRLLADVRESLSLEVGEFGETFGLGRTGYSNWANNMDWSSTPIDRVVELARQYHQTTGKSLLEMLVTIDPTLAREEAIVGAGASKAADDVLTAIRSLSPAELLPIVPELLNLIRDGITPVVQSVGGGIMACEAAAALLRETLTREKIKIGTDAGNRKLASVLKAEYGGSGIDRLTAIVRGEIVGLDEYDLNMIAYVVRCLGGDDSPIQAIVPCKHGEH